jgi:4-amino-4-deoxy-L-arabinose transferase-like glycosyltransferase
MGCDQLGANGESEMLVRGGWGRVTIAVILFLAGGYFVLTAGRSIDLPGLQYDEILFVNAATGEPTNGLFVWRRVLGVPIMVMPYMGAVKAYLYYPVFKVFGVSPATIRWPVIILSLVTLGLIYGVARSSFARLTSALLVLVVAVDPTFIYTTKIDVGPTALMMLLKLAVLFFALRTVTTGSPVIFGG